MKSAMNHHTAKAELKNPPRFSLLELALEAGVLIAISGALVMLID